MTLFDNFLKSNESFFSRHDEEVSKGFVLFDLFYSEKPLIYGISKIAVFAAKVKGLEPLAITPVKFSKSNKRFVRSFGYKCLNNYFEFAKTIFLSFIPIIMTFSKVKDGQSLLSLKYGKYELGEYIYDSVLRARMIPTIECFDNSIRKKILIELVYFFYFKNLVENKPIKLIISGDCVYRYGLLFELAKKNEIPCISPVNLNAFSMAYHKNSVDYETYYRTAPKESLNAISVDVAKNYLADYFNLRYTASLEQHDVLKAYSSDKRILSKSELFAEYQLDNGKPVVVIMSHIFCDAPHSYPGMIYADYYQWLVRTIELLTTNKNVNFLVKEHPSADLYNEGGIIKDYLSSIGLEHTLLRDDMHNLTILNEADVVVTCGGTIGQEFAYFGKPVVLAAKPPYSMLGFTYDFDLTSDYESFLIDGIQNCKNLDSTQMSTVYKTLYYDFVLTDNYSDDLELGGQRYYMGRDFDDDLFYQNLIQSNGVAMNEQKVYKMLEELLVNSKRHIVRGSDES